MKETYPEEVVTDEGDLSQRFLSSVWNDERSTSTEGDLVVKYRFERGACQTKGMPQILAEF